LVEHEHEHEHEHGPEAFVFLFQSNYNPKTHYLAMAGSKSLTSTS